MNKLINLIDELKQSFDKLPNLVQSFLVILLAAGLDYVFGGQPISLRGLGVALFVAAANFYTSHRAALLKLAVIDKLESVAAPVVLNATPAKEDNKPNV